MTQKVLDTLCPARDHDDWILCGLSDFPAVRCRRGRGFGKGPFMEARISLRSWFLRGSAIAPLCFLSLGAGRTRAGDIFYSNAPLSTGAVTEFGENAPAGTTWSELQHDAGNYSQVN